MKSFVALSLPLLALSAPTTVERDSSSPSSYKINKVVYGGSGCPQGSLDINWTNNGILPICTVPSRKCFIHLLINVKTDFGNQFSASVGPNVGVDQSRKNCQLNFDISYSPGYSYQVYSADYTGYADIDSGVTAVVAAHYYFSGQTDQVRLPIFIYII